MDDKKRPIGSKAKRNGKTVLWAGEDYGYQSPSTFKELKDKGELALGAGLVRRVKGIAKKVDKARDRVFGTATPDSIEGKIIKAIEGVSDKTVGSKAGKGADIASREISKRLGISPAIGGLLLGSFFPGGTASKRGGAGRPLSRAEQRLQNRMVNPSTKISDKPGRYPNNATGNTDPSRAQRAGKRQGQVTRGAEDSIGSGPPRQDRAERANRGGAEANTKAIRDRQTKVQQQALDKFFSGDKTAPTFSSKKGSGRRPVSNIDEVVDAAFENNGKTYEQQGFYFDKSKVSTGRSGRSGQVQVLANSIQQERIANGKKPLSKSQLAETVKKRLETYRNTELKGQGNKPSPAAQREIDRRNRQTERAGKELRDRNRQLRDGRSDGNPPPKPDSRRQESKPGRKPVTEVPPPQGPSRPQRRKPAQRPPIPAEPDSQPMVARGDRARGERQVGQRPQGQIPTRPGDGGSNPASLQNPRRGSRMTAEQARQQLRTPDGFMPNGEVRGLSVKGSRDRRGRSDQSGGVELSPAELKRLRQERTRRRGR